MTISAPSTTLADLDDAALADRLHDAGRRVATELRKVIVGQDAVVEQALIALFAGGNVLLVGVPGLAKTLLVHSLARALDLRFARIQFTPDLMPSDVTGTDVIQDDPATGQRKLNFLPGPVFANILLADEINRTPPKTQSALLEAMQEHRVTVQGKTYPLEQPFFVFATQNPIELEGTYPLPEAQLDRFFFEIVLDYLPEDDEIQVVQATTAAPPEAIRPVLSREEILAMQAVVRRVPVADEVVRHAVRLVRATRPGDGAPDYIAKWLSYGASVRAAQAMVLGGKARALLQGRSHVSFEDVRALARSVLRHRLLRTFQAQSERVTTDTIVARVLESVPPPRSGL
ncbi:MAG: MoxR family ATPase [Gemmatimonadales bacterium]|nr:MoxR family ATPase [Gemmatimonadales bacterium]MDZ4259613.1 MoxR family ATPase [Gemmatimonadales bacterium]MDZ4389228.1 MoxR family ATPase [Gemmatimonadales bacterium]